MSARRVAFVVGTLCVLLAPSCDNTSDSRQDDTRPIDSDEVGDILQNDSTETLQDGESETEGDIEPDTPIDTAPDSRDTEPETADTGDAETDGECVADEQCGPERGCLYGVCRDECYMELICYAQPSGRICVDGLCVACEHDDDCTGGNLTCDTNRYLCVPRTINPNKLVVGAMYHQWWTTARWQGDRGNYVYEPLLGHYDNSNPAVVQQHLDWAERAGMNTFVLDTWITDRDWSWVEPNSLAVMNAADQRDFKYFLLIDGWFEFTGGDDGYDAQAIAAKVVQRFASWFDRPGYLKVNGKPVIFFWAAWGKPCSVFDLIRAGIEGQVGPIYLTGNNGDTACWDRVMMYNPYTGSSSSYDAQIERQEGMWSDWEQKRHPWAPTAMPGYDDTHVREGNPPVPLNEAFFRRSLRTAMSYNQHADPWLFVCSFSEWHEGSNIEPSSDFDDPYLFLDAMRDELEAAGWIE